MNKSDLIRVLSKDLQLNLAKSQDIVHKVFETMVEPMAYGSRYGDPVPLP